MEYTLSLIAALSGGRLKGAERDITAVATDSRNQILMPAQTLFVALTGFNHDGHRYLDELYRRGVRSFLVGRMPASEAEFPEASFVVVVDPLTALQALSAHHRSLYSGTVVAITGSNGKTIVKEWIAQLWPASAGKLLRSPRSFNSQLGVALSLLMIEGDEKLVVIEAGISQPGEMERLATMIRPEIGLLTHFGEAHQEHFASPEQKLDEKLILFANARTILYSSEDERLARRMELSFGAKAKGWHFQDVDLSALSLTNPASRENAGHALALYRVLGIEPKSLSELQPVAMRLERREGVLGSTLIDDSYNSDLGSLAIALDHLSHNAGGALKAVILSDILQSSLPSKELYSQVASMLRAHGIEQFTGIGPALQAAAPLFAEWGTKVRFFPSTESFLRSIDKADYAHHFILIKGSRPFGFERISRLFEKRSHTTTLEVNLTAMAANLTYYRSLLSSETRVMAMVKAHSYGSGSIEVASMLQHEGVDSLAVAFADEGVTLREGGIHLPIIVLNSDPGSFGVMADYGLEPEIYSLEALASYAAEVRSRGIPHAPIHLKLDTGMHRLGFLEEELPKLTEWFRVNPTPLRVRSIFSHLAAAEDPAEDAFTRSQIARFERMSEAIRQELGDSAILRHLCNSAGIERFPEAHFDLVRLGIGLHGTENPSLQVVSTLKTQVVQIKFLQAGETIGYNRRGIAAPEGTRIAILPIGYADGMDRHLGNGKGAVNIRGTLCPTIGNICMDTCMVDISAAPQTDVGDEAIIFGKRPTAKALATVLDTISYEVLTSVSSRIKRIYTKE